MKNAAVSGAISVKSTTENEPMENKRNGWSSPFGLLHSCMICTSSSVSPVLTSTVRTFPTPGA